MLNRALAFRLATVAVCAGAITVDAQTPQKMLTYKVVPNTAAQARYLGFATVTKRPIPLTGLLGAAATMNGWTPFTDGAATSSPLVLTIDTGTYVLTRGADGGLYALAINPAHPGGPVDSAAWSLAQASVPGDLDCQPSTFASKGAAGQVSSTVVMGCVGSNAAGALQVFSLTGYEGSLGAVSDLAAGAAMAPIHARGRPTFFYNVPYQDYEYEKDGDSHKVATYAVWDSAGRVEFADDIVRITAVKVGEFGSTVTAFTQPHSLQGWRQGPMTIAAPPTCRAGLAPPYTTCVWAAVDKTIAFADMDTSARSTSGAAWPQQSLGAPGPGAVDAPSLTRSETTLLLSVRGLDGHLYQAMRTTQGWGKWRDQGGDLKPGSQASCLAMPGGSLCFVQGIDGRLWWRMAPSPIGPSGL